MTVFVDTAVWIDFFRSKSGSVHEPLRALLDEDRVVLAAPVRVELLAGVRAADAPRLRRVLDALETLRPTDATWQRMEEWALHGSERGQRFGVGDLLVAAIAADWQGSLWSLDRDFERMAKLGFVSLHQPATA